MTRQRILIWYRNALRVNNLFTLDIEDARRQFEVNLFGLAHITKLVLPSMRTKKFGKVINISPCNNKVAY